MKNIRNYLLNLYATDLIVIGFATFLTFLNIIFCSKIDRWALHVFANTAITFIIFAIAHYDKKKSGLLLEQLHYWYVVPLIFLTFKELYYMIKPIHGVDYDNYLISIDRFIFGTDPTHVLYFIANPILTEILQISYATFFFLPIILGINLLLNGKNKEFHFTTFSVVFGFFLSYVGYFFLPAIGPRFTLHDFAATNTELPGLFLTNYLREIVNAGESIPSGTLNPIEVVQRDVFPSGHTQMTLIVMYLSVKFKSCMRWFILPVGTMLIFSTVYLRYHYFVDLLGGTIFMITTMYLGYRLYNYWMRQIGEEEFRHPKFK